MRRLATLLIALTLAVLAAAAGSAAAAQEWKEYVYPADAFSVAFPADPKLDTTTYQAADGRMVEARVYSVAQDDGVFRMTVADLAESGMVEKTVVDHAVNTLSEGGEIKLDIPHRISRIYGRQLSILRADGSRSMVAVFYYKQRLYQIEGTALASGRNGTADAIRFQQSLVFTDDGGTNRSTSGLTSPL
jgi:hypothetical protein